MRLIDSFFLALAACGAFGMHCLTAGHTAPQPSWATKATVVRVVDGDTLDVEIRRVVRIRMLDCWAPESKQDPRLPEDRRQAEKVKGQASKSALAKLADGQVVTVQIPLDADGDISKSMTMGRVLGYVWLASDPAESLSEKQVRKGHATKEKPEELR